MALADKYKELTNAATAAGISDLAVREQDGVLYIDGTAPTGAVKDQLWNIYDKIDPNFVSGDLVMNVNTSMTGNCFQAHHHRFQATAGDDHFIRFYFAAPIK